jgi:hypothetical protein
MPHTNQLSFKIRKLLWILPAIAAVALSQFACAISFNSPSETTPDMTATGMVQTLTAVNAQIEQQQQQAPQPEQQQPPQQEQADPSTSTPTPTASPTPTLTATTKVPQPQKPTNTLLPTKPPPAPEITSFTISKTKINKSESATLAWDTKNTDKVTIAWGPDELDKGKSNSGFTIKGSDLGDGNFTFTLKATGGGKTVTKTVSLEVIAAAPPAPAPVINSFTADKTCLNPGDIMTLTWSTSNVDTAYLETAKDNYPLSTNSTGWTIGHHNIDTGGAGAHDLILHVSNAVGVDSSGLTVVLPCP